MQFAAALLIIALTMIFLVRGTEVRLTLFAAGLALALLAVTPLTVFDAFLAEATNGKTIGPICSAMGYAFVLRATGADREAVQLLLAPARRLGWLLIPGGCLTGFVMNIAITSQTACVAAVAPILVPLMRAAGFPAVIAGATLVLGCSGGGSLYNPGDADLVAIQESSKAPMHLALGAMFWPLLAGVATAVAVFVGFSRRETPATETTSLPSETHEPRARWKALLPPLPMVLIFIFLPGVVWTTPPAPFDKGLPVLHAMLFATLVAIALCRREAMASAKAFFEGMGYAYANIISLVVTASCFIAGMTAVGLTERLVKLVSGTGLGAKLAAGFFPGALGVITGSGIGPSVAFSKAVLPALRDANLPAALDLGVLGAIAATFGRSMSPAAAVVIFSAAQANVPVTGLVKRTAPALLVGYAITLLVVILRQS